MSPISRSAIRDDYTTLAWLGGSVALDRMQRPASAVAMYRPLRPRRPLAPGPDEGLLLGGPRRAGGGAICQEANAYFQRAAAYPELFYGQLALERLGRSVTPPPQAVPQ